jgi:hypothetical protein
LETDIDWCSLYGVRDQSRRPFCELRWFWRAAMIS